MDDDEVQDLDPETLVRLACIKTLNQDDVEATDKFYTDDATYYRSEHEPLELEDLKQDAREFREAFPNMEATVEEVIVDGNHVAFHYTIRGTHEGPFKGVPPTDESFQSQGIGYAQLEGGLVDEYSLVFDRLGTMQQLGLMG